jgi:hypothetical protein
MLPGKEAQALYLINPVHVRTTSTVSAEVLYVEPPLWDLIILFSSVGSALNRVHTSSKKLFWSLFCLTHEACVLAVILGH